MKTLCMLNDKGGVGKTANAITISHMLVTVHKKKVLMVDMDPQGNLSAQFSSDDWYSIFISILKGVKLDKDKSVEDILLDPQMDVREAIRHTKYENLDIIPSHLTLSEVEELLKANVKTPQQFKLMAQLEKVKDEYDYCIIDCSPSINILNINALVAADEVYIPLRCDGNSCIGMAITLNLISTVQSYNPNLKLGGCFFTQFDKRKAVSKQIYDLLQQELPKGMLLPFKIGTTKFLEQNTFEQKPLLEVDSGKRKSNVTLTYLKFTEYLVSQDRESFLNQYEDELALEEEQIKTKKEMRKK